MKSINVYFEDEEYQDLLALKGSMTWRDFIIECAKWGVGKN